MVQMNSSLASQIQQDPAVDVVVEDFIISPVSDETTPQKTRRVPVTYIGRDSNSNSPSTTRSRRGNTREGTIIAIKDAFPQREWLS